MYLGGCAGQGTNLLTEGQEIQAPVWGPLWLESSWRNGQAHQRGNNAGKRTLWEQRPWVLTKVKRGECGGGHAITLGGGAHTRRPCAHRPPALGTLGAACTTLY